VLRYALLELPGNVLLVLVILAVDRWWIPVPFWAAAGLVGLWLLKDIALFPFLWRAYDWDATDDPTSMIGRRGEVAQRLSPEGFVRVRGELWKAQTLDGRGVVEVGRRITVRRVEGLKLYVEPLADTKEKSG
jgi:membrane protein implicated in regulation of membrane protease activity